LVKPTGGILLVARVLAVDIDDLECLESEVLDDLESVDDADAPPGTVRLEAVRRRRALADAAGLLRPE
jgi:hypothetical protein